MRTITAACLVLLTVLMSFVAYDLHQIANTVGVASGVGTYAQHLTRAEQLKVIQQGTTDALETFDAITKAPEPLGRKAPATPSR